MNIDVSSEDPLKILNFSNRLLLELGERCTIDDKGPVTTGIDHADPKTYKIYYQELIYSSGCLDNGIPSLLIPTPTKHDFGQPWIIKSAENHLQMFYSIRQAIKGSNGQVYVESIDGINWMRNDREMGLSPSIAESNSKSAMFSSVIRIRNRRFYFYKGNNFSESGIVIEELLKWT